MKYMLTLALVGFCGLAGSVGAEQTVVLPSQAELKLEELAALPVGLIVTHSPDGVSANKQGPTGLEWIHSTTVTATSGPVTIVEFGCLYRAGDRWRLGTVTRAPYNAANFAQWYNCPEARLQPGQSYTDDANVTLSSGLPDRITKWYFIGIDAKGNRIKGEANVNLLSDPTMDGC